MIESFISDCTSQKRPCYFISPHFDDAILSAGALISYLSDKTKVFIITVFTQISPPPYTRSAWQFIKQCGFQNPHDLFVQRKREDESASKSAGVTGIYLSYTDAIFRKIEAPNRIWRLAQNLIPELVHIYPVYKLNIAASKISPYDDTLLTRLKNELRTLIPPDALVFYPLSINSHIDHIIVHRVGETLFPNGVAWLDFPYHKAVSSEIETVTKQQGLTIDRWEKNLDKKETFIGNYTSQIRSLFGGNPISLSPEYYFKKAISY